MLFAAIAKAAAGDQQAALSVDDDLAVTARIRGDDRCADQRRLHQGAPEAVFHPWRDHHVEARNHGLNRTSKSKESNMLRHALVPGKSLEVRLISEAIPPGE